MKPAFNTILKQAAMLLMLALMTSASSWAQIVGVQTDFITDVILIGGSESEVNTMKTNYQSKGWTVIDQNLNEGAGGDFIYLLYKTANIYNTFDFTFITDFCISTEQSGPGTIDGRTYFLTECYGSEAFVGSFGNLNRGAGGDKIFLFYTKEYGTYRDAISSIYFNSEQSNAVGKNGGSSKGYNFNSNAGGRKIYMHCSFDRFSGWTITKNNYGDKCIITGYDGPTEYITSITIPTKIEEATVIGFSCMDFSGFQNLETIYFNDDCSIDEMPSFEGCSKLRHINWIYSNNVTVEDWLPFSIKKIPSCTFSGTAISKLFLTNVSSVESFAFENCDKLSKVSFGHSANLAVDAFAYIKSSCSVDYPGSMSDWSPDVYRYSPDFFVTNNADSYRWCWGWEAEKYENECNHLFWSIDMNGHFAVDCYDDAWETHPQTLRNFKWQEYSGLKFLKSVTLNHVDTIGYQYLKGFGCYFNYGAFEECNNLVSVELNEGLKSIGYNAFKDCTSLASINIPNSVTNIGELAFYNCCGLISISVGPENRVYDSRDNCNAIIHTSSNMLVQGCQNTVIPKSVTCIGDCAFINCEKLKSINIPNSVTSIGKDAFSHCSGVTDVYCYADPSVLIWDDGDCDDFKDDRATICHVFNASDWSAFVDKVNVTFVGDLGVNLIDNASNTTAISESINVPSGAILNGRTITLDGDWNTLCLPFNVDAFARTPLEGFTVKQLDIATAYDGHKTGLENGTLYLNFKDATSITAGKPYIVKGKTDLVISSEADWNTFAQSVSNGTTYEGKVVRLGADINVSTMAGKDGFPFKGTLDGNGHTVNLNLRGGGQGLALFYVIDGATIKNVSVTGTVTSSYHRPATFAAFVNGSSTIKNCWSSVAIVSTHGNAWIDGGAFVSRIASGVTLTMTDCAFTGSVTYNDNTYSGGSMVGFTQSGAKANLTNCMYFPTALALTAVAYNPHIFVSGDERGNLTNCYYNAVARASILVNEGIDGSDMNAAALAAVLGANWEVNGSVALPKCIIQIKNPVFYDVTISSDSPTAVTSGDGKVSFKGNYDPVGIGNEGDDTMLFLGEGNNLRRPNAAMDINAFRAWFQLASSTSGDMNGDGIVSVSDVTLLVDHILGANNDNFIIENADINCDRIISVTDVTALVDIILGNDSINSTIDIQNVVINGADGLTFSNGGSGPARASRK